MFHWSRASIAALILLLSPSIALALGDAISSFESEGGFPLQSEVASLPGWERSDAGFVISDAAAQSGGQSLEILPSKEERAARRTFPVPVNGIVFFDFFILPFSDEAESPAYLIDANGARLGFLRQTEESGTVVAVSPTLDPKTKGNAIESGFSFPLNEEGISAQQWIRVTIRQDLRAGKWDLFLDGELRLADEALADAALKKAAEVEFFALAGGPTFVDDLTIGGDNPLFPDADRDGVPDAMEEALGGSPKVNERSAPGIGGKFLLQRFAAASRGEAGQARAPGAKRFVYIDSRNGSDQDSGEFSYRAGGRGPRASLRSLVKEGAANTVVVLMPSPVPYVCADFPPGQAPDLQISEQGTVTLTTE